MLTPTQSEIIRLTKIHLNRYRKRLEAAQRGSPRVNTADCTYYLGIWQSIESKLCRWEALSPTEKAEVNDAIEAGE